MWHGMVTHMCCWLSAVRSSVTDPALVSDWFNVWEGCSWDGQCIQVNRNTIMR